MNVPIPRIPHNSKSISTTAMRHFNEQHFIATAIHNPLHILILTKKHAVNIKAICSHSRPIPNDPFNNLWIDPLMGL